LLIRLPDLTGNSTVKLTAIGSHWGKMRPLALAVFKEGLDIFVDHKTIYS